MYEGLAACGAEGVHEAAVIRALGLHHDHLWKTCPGCASSNVYYVLLGFHLVVLLTEGWGECVVALVCEHVREPRASYLVVIHVFKCHLERLWC